MSDNKGPDVRTARKSRLLRKQDSAADTQKIGIIVAGMHRSGTSATTRLLNLLGFDISPGLISADHFNATGYWEAESIYQLNDQMLAAAGLEWNSWEPVNPGWFSSPSCREFRNRTEDLLKAHFPTSQQFVVKDPRISRLLPVWIEAFRNVGATPMVVAPVRSPIEVAASLLRRNGLNTSTGQLLWLRHVLDEELYTRDLTRVHIRYDDLLTNWRGVVDRIGEKLGGVMFPRRSIAVEMEIDAFVSASHKHHNAGSETTAVKFSPWINRAYEIFDGWCTGAEAVENQAELDRLRLAFDDACRTFVRPVLEHHAHGMLLSARLEAVQAEQAAVRTQYEGDVEALNQSLHERESALRQLKTAEEDLVTQLAAAGARVEKDAEAIEALRVEAAQIREQVQALEAEKGMLAGDIARLGDLMRDKDDDIARLGDLVRDKDNDIAQLGDLVRGKDDDIARLGDLVRDKDDDIARLGDLVRGKDDDLAEAAEHKQTLQRLFEELSREAEALRGDLKYKAMELAETEKGVAAQKAELLELKSQLADKDRQQADIAAEAEDLRQQLTALLAMHETQGAELDAANKEILARNTALADHDREAAEARATLDDLERALKAANGKIAELQVQHDEDAARALKAREALEQALADAGDAIAELEAGAEEAALLVSDLQDELEDRDMAVAAVQSDLAASRLSFRREERLRKESANVLRIVSEERSAALFDLENLRVQLSQREEAVTRMASELARLNAIEQSTAWRATRILRNIATRLPLLRRIIRSMAPLYRGLRGRRTITSVPDRAE